MNYETFNHLTFGLYIAFALVLFYQSWMNLVKKQLTKFSLDALILVYLRIRQGEKSVKRARKLLANETNRLRLLGIWALISGVAFIYFAIDLYIKYLS